MLNKILKQITLVIISLVILISFSTIISAADIISFDKVADTTYFKELKINDGDNAESVFTLDTKAVLDSSALTFTFNEVCGEVKDYYVLQKSICLINESTPVYEKQLICTNLSTTYLNGSKEETPVEECVYKDVVTGYINDSYYDICYIPFNTLVDYAKDYKIKATIKPGPCFDGSYGYKIDWIPSVKIGDTIYEKSEWAWWNESVSIDTSTIIAHYSFDGDYNDKKSGYNATNSGTDIIDGNCISGSCASSGSGDYISLANVISVVNTYTAGAYSFWVKVNSSAANQWFFNYHLEEQNRQRIYYAGDGNDYIQVALQLNDSWEYTDDSNDQLLVNSWYFIVYQNNGTDWFWYINDSTNGLGDSEGWWDDFTASTFRVGNVYDGSAALLGIIDEFTLWNDTLNASERASLFQNGTGINLTYLIDNPSTPGGGGGGSYELSITLNSPANNTYTNNNNYTFNFTPVSSSASAINCTFFYDGVSYYFNSSVVNNTAHAFYSNTSLPDGNKTWYINCLDGTNTTTSSTARLLLITSNPLISYFNVEGTNFYTNTSMNFNVTATTILGSLSADIDCYINSTSLIYSMDDIGLTNNTGYDFATIDSGNYSKNDNVSCNITIQDNATNTNSSSAYTIILDTKPSIPTDINFSSTAFYYNYNTSFQGSGSTDIDSDAITYYYEVYNINDTTIRQSFSKTSYYLPLLSDIGDTLRIGVKAVTSAANSSIYNETKIVYLSSATFFIRREKDNSVFNVSHADELILNIICADDVQEINITSNTTELNISCAYEYLKLDYTFGNESYFRIRNPDYTGFSNITFYMLDLRYDTAIEIIININDLSGGYSDGEISVDRYINSTQVNIMSQPFDIENSATLYFLRNGLYTITVTNNNGDSQVIGDLIASEAGEKTLTLPQIDFMNSDIVIGDQLAWNYSYNNGFNNSYIVLYYFDGIGGSSNVTYSIFAENDSRVFRTSMLRTTNLTSNTIHTITYSPLPNLNISYYSLLEITHDAFSNTIVDYAVFIRNGSIITETSSTSFISADFAEKISDVLFWIGLLITFVIGLAFDAQSSKVGLVFVMFLLTMFIAFGFISFGGITGVVASIIGVVVVFNFITKSRRETGGD